MTLTQATRQARRRARETDEARYVVWSTEDGDRPGQHYHVATEEDLSTWFGYCDDPVAVFDSEGRQT